MSEEKALYEVGSKIHPMPLDRFGITECFAVHLDLCLVTMHPEEASRAAFAAVQGYLKSYSFIDTTTKASEGCSYQMVRKREEVRP
jgi:hypothetical protein